MRITVIIPTFNSEKNLAEAIQSVLKQSLGDLECIVADEGSSDGTIAVAHSFNDPRLVVLEYDKTKKVTTYAQALFSAKGLFVARMDANDLMHVDRLKIQASILEDEPSIAACGTQVLLFNETIKPQIGKNVTGIIEDPLIQLLGDFVINPATLMYRYSFLKMNKILNESLSPLSGDLQLMIDVAKNEGILYVESQPLHYQRIEEPIQHTTRNELLSVQKEAIGQVKDELLHYLIEATSSGQRQYIAIEAGLRQLNESGLIQEGVIPAVFRMLFAQHKTLAKG
jgi:glycosyltransferase involved in cell wall biosynthesis